METKTMFRKGIASCITKGVLTQQQQRRLARAVIDLQSKDLDTLCKLGRVRKMNIVGNENLYLYRMGMHERVVFSPLKGKNYIHDIIDVKENSSLIPIEIKMEQLESNTSKLIKDDRRKRMT